MDRPADYFANMYGTPEYQQWRERFAYVEAPEYLCETEILDNLGDGFTAEIKIYRHNEQRNPQYVISHAKADICTLLREGEPVFRWKDIGGHVRTCFPILHHANGRRYLPFREDLYGMGFLDVDSLECFRYIPRGFTPPEDFPLGESFIITAIHYDPQTNLVAYEGCFWGGYYDTRIAILDDPLHFSPQTVSLLDWLDPEGEHEDVEDVDFVAWEDGILIVQDTAKRQYRFSAEELRAKLG